MSSEILVEQMCVHSVSSFPNFVEACFEGCSLGLSPVTRRYPFPNERTPVFLDFNRLAGEWVAIVFLTLFLVPADCPSPCRHTMTLVFKQPAACHRVVP